MGNPEIVNYHPASEERSLKAEVGRTFVSTASSAGVWMGLIVAGTVFSAFKDRKEKKTNAETPETPETV
jgi:hypothetical protein